MKEYLLAAFMFTAAVVAPIAAAAQAQPSAPAPAPVVAPPIAVDPARLAEARRTIDHIFPAGTYRRLMGGNFLKMMGGVSDIAFDMPVRDVITIGGMPAQDAERIPAATRMRDVLVVIDPAYRERNRILFDAMMAGMTNVMNDFEPEVRDALARAYAAKFIAAQLAEMNRFFATPTGTLYAQNAMSLSMDPAFTDRMLQLTPRLLDAMPRIARAAAAETKSLPPRRSWSTLTAAERERLNTLFGLPAADTQRAVEAVEKQQQQRDGAVDSEVPRAETSSPSLH